tara:strand:+ start:428 stop:628 length:201 start_codon:yes stop_codon:yes gene_type:complete
MRLVEFKDNSRDEFSKIDIDQARRPRLTLRHLNKLKSYNASKKKEEVERIKTYKKIYGTRFQGEQS